MVIASHAKRLYKRAFPWLGGWPTGWRVEWTDYLPDAFGQTCWSDKLILICKTGAKDNPKHYLEDTIIHELCHMVYGPQVPHGRSFSARVRWAKQRAKNKK